MTKKRRPHAVRHFGFKCPYPDCGHIGSYITKAHCELAHGMDRVKLFKKYGEPKEVTYDRIAYQKNMQMAAIIYDSDYDTTEYRAFSATLNQ